MKKTYSLRLETIPIAVLLLVTSIALGLNATRWFDFYDMSIFMDAGYRVYRGQRLYADFYHMAGPMHPYLHALFFHAFGFTKTAVIVHLCVVNLIITGATYVLCRKYLSLGKSLFITLIAAITFYGPISHPWYDQNACLWIVLALTLYEFEWFKPALTAFLCGALVALSFFTKSNYGAAAGGVFFVLLLFRRPRLLGSLSYLLGILVVFGVIAVSLGGLGDFYEQTMSAYSPGHRLLDFAKLKSAANHFSYRSLAFVVFFMVVFGGLTYLKTNLRLLALLSGLLAISVFSVWTGSMAPSANMILVGVEIALMVILLERLPTSASGTPESRVRIVGLALALLFALSQLGKGIERSLELTAWTWRGAPAKTDYAFQAAPFRGWKCPRETCEGIDRTIVYLKENVPEHDSLFVFPDANVLYGLTGRIPPLKTPTFFSQDEFLKGKFYREFRDGLLSKPPTWIVLHQQSRIPTFSTNVLLHWLQLDDWMHTHYEPQWSFGEFSVLHYRG